MTNRWQVRVHQSHTNGAKNPKCRWVVDPPGFDYIKRAEHTSNWHRAGGKWFQWDARLTKREAWEAALAYADRMSRTVRVELPRVRGRTRGCSCPAPWDEEQTEVKGPMSSRRVSKPELANETN